MIHARSQETDVVLAEHLIILAKSQQGFCSDRSAEANQAGSGLVEEGRGEEGFLIFAVTQ